MDIVEARITRRHAGSDGPACAHCCRIVSREDTRGAPAVCVCHRGAIPAKPQSISAWQTGLSSGSTPEQCSPSDAWLVRVRRASQQRVVRAAPVRTATWTASTAAGAQGTSIYGVPRPVLIKPGGGWHAAVRRAYSSTGRSSRIEGPTARRRRVPFDVARCIWMRALS